VPSIYLIQAVVLSYVTPHLTPTGCHGRLRDVLGRDRTLRDNLFERNIKESKSASSGGLIPPLYKFFNPEIVVRDELPRTPCSMTSHTKDKMS
jgi:hypothetical protein